MRRAALGLALALVAGAGCGDSRGGTVPEAVPPASVVRVFAATALTEAFEALGEQFTASNPDVRVDFTFAASPTLVRQVARGEAASVLATGDPVVMRDAEEQGHARASVPFARNHLVLVVARDNPKAIASLDDLARDDVRFGMCDALQPCGVFGLAALAEAGVERAPAMTGENTRVVLNGVLDGSVDAGIVFQTTAGLDAGARLAASLDGHDALYEITVLAGAVDPDGASAFVAFVVGPRGQAVLAGLGFDPV